MKHVICPPQTLDRLLFTLQSNRAGQEPGITPRDKDHMVHRCVSLFVCVGWGKTVVRVKRWGEVVVVEVWVFLQDRDSCPDNISCFVLGCTT